MFVIPYKLVETDYPILFAGGELNLLSIVIFLSLNH